MALALVVVEEHARGAVHLRNDNALGAVDDEGTVVGHERHVAHVDVLFLDVLDRLCAGILVNIEHDQAQGHLERCRVGQIALTAFFDVELRLFEFVGNELEHRSAGEILDRENRLENGLKALVRASALGLFNHKKLVVGCLLNLDEVRHLRDFWNFTKKLAYAPATVKRKGLSHRRSLSILHPGLQRTGTDGQSTPSINE
ncbi:hypothetical protein D9M72_470210 [compost metagenome]